MRAARVRQVVRHAPAAIVLVVAGAVLLSVVVLAAVHVDDRYGVSAASGVWMGLSSALRDGVFYPAVYANGFYGGTRYMPLPFILEAGAAAISNELLVSAKLLIYAVAGGLYTLLYWVARRRGAPLPIALGLVAAVLATAAGLMTAVGIRWDALATLLQLAAVAVTVNHERSQRRAALSGLLCALALAAKISALWAPVALALWLAVVARRSLGSFLASLVGSCIALAVLFETLSSGRLFENMRLFAFGGSDAAPALEGVHRLYQFALRDQREGAILIFAAAVGVVVAVLKRRAGPYEIGFVASILVLLVVMRDGGAYENHLLDLLVLTAAVVAGMWTSFAAGRARQLVQALVIVSILVGTLLAVRYTIVPDMRAAVAHELRGKADDRYAADVLAGSPGVERVRALRGCLHPTPRGQAPHRAGRLHPPPPADEATGRARPHRRAREATVVRSDRAHEAAHRRRLVRSSRLRLAARPDHAGELHARRSHRESKPVDLRPQAPTVGPNGLPARDRQSVVTGAPSSWAGSESAAGVAAACFQPPVAPL